MNENSSEQMEKNFEYLVKQLKFTGMPETLQFELKEKMSNGERDLAIKFQTDMGRHPAEATLNFRKSDKGNYFFNSYDLVVQPENSEALKQRFYINAPETGKAMGPDGVVIDKTINSTITLKEALNLLTPLEEAQRHVLKNQVSQKGDVYSNWVSLDMTQKVKDNYPLVHKPTFDVEEKLRSLNVVIKDLENPALREAFLESLQKGNRQVAAVVSPSGAEYWRGFEVNAVHRTVRVYDGENRLSHSKIVPTDNPKEAQTQTQGQQHSQKQGAKPGQESDGIDDALGENQPKKRKGRKMAA